MTGFAGNCGFGHFLKKTLMGNFFSVQCALRKAFWKTASFKCPTKIVGLVSEIYSILVSLHSKITFWSLNLCELFLYFFYYNCSSYQISRDFLKISQFYLTSKNCHNNWKLNFFSPIKKSKFFMESRVSASVRCFLNLNKKQKISQIQLKLYCWLGTNLANCCSVLRSSFLVFSYSPVGYLFI